MITTIPKASECKNDSTGFGLKPRLHHFLHWSLGQLLDSLVSSSEDGKDQMVSQGGFQTHELICVNCLVSVYKYLLSLKKCELSVDCVKAKFRRNRLAVNKA